MTVSPFGSIRDLTSNFASGTATPSEILTATLGRVEELNPVVNAIAEIDVEGAYKQAAASDARWSSGQQLGPLDGVPVSVKDSVNAIGMTWRHGTAPNANLPPSITDAPPTARLREAGAIVFAKNTMPDLGMMAAGVSSLYGIVRNPWEPESNSGGSSAGAGAALAAGLVYGAIGTDIAGSVRLPAGHCGVTALKPTQGQIPHTPASTMRSAGPMARSVGDLSLLFDVVAQPDRRDTLGLPAPAPASAVRSMQGLRVALLAEIGYQVGPSGHGADADVLGVVDSAAAALRNLGAVVTPSPPPFDSDVNAALDRVFAVRALAEINGFQPDARRSVEPHIAAWAAQAADFSAERYHRDLADVAAAADRFSAHFADHDLVLAPVIPVVSFPAEHVGIFPDQPLRHCGFTCWFNQTGQPAGTIPFGWVGGHPVGVQIAAKRFEDRLVLDALAQLETVRSVTEPWPTPTTSAKATDD